MRAYIYYIFKATFVTAVADYQSENTLKLHDL